MTIRLCKLVLVANTLVFLALVVFNNTTDYGSNYHFIEHVLSMDTTFPGNAGMWRAIHSPAIYRLFYAVIIGWEAAAAALIGVGCLRLLRALRLDAAAWNRAKSFAAAGLTLSMTQWYLAFTSVGGEWFLMWQSKVWNGQDAALRMFTLMGISLVFLCLPDRDDP